MENIEEIKAKSKEEVNLMSPLIWAYVGDAVYELYIRNYLINTTKLKPHQLHIKTIEYVKAGAQAQILQNITDQLTRRRKGYYTKRKKYAKSPFT